MSTSPPPVAGDTVPALSISVTGKLLLAGVIIFFFLFVFLLILILRANRYLGANPALASSPVRFLLTSLPRRALDPAVLRSLPVIVFNSVAFKESVECAVCLSELADGDAARLLPGCRHVFHLECIDMWFGSNSTCPICRSSINPLAIESKNTILGDLEPCSAVKNTAFPLEMVMTVDGSGEGSSSSVCSVSRKTSRILAIDIPKIALESSAFALHSSRIFASVEVNSSNLRSLRRILSMGSRGCSSDCSSRCLDIEQGAASTAAAAAAAGVASDCDGSSSNKHCERRLSLNEENVLVKEG